MKKRLEYIDVLKGIAIFLVVMGHFLSWTFRETPHEMNGRFIRDLIYAFHMPLFMFLSGYVIDLWKTSFDVARGLHIIKKRIVSLVLPCIAFYMISGFCEVPWFLRALFEIIVVYIICRCISLLFGRYRGIAEVVLFGLGYVSIFILTRIIRDTSADDILSMTQFQIMYPFFIMGYIFRSYKIDLYLKERNIAYTLSLAGFIVFFYLYHYAEHGPLLHPVYRYILGACGIVFSYLFVCSVVNNRICKLFMPCGKYSIEIYLLSYYFTPKLLFVGDYIQQTAKQDVYTSVFVQLFTGVLISIYVCCMCIASAKIIEKSKILSLVIFGKR